ncbi:MAG: ATP-binding protein [Acidimicrobiales bacterium]
MTEVSNGARSDLVGALRRALPLPLRDPSFWVVQGAVVVLASVHLILDLYPWTEGRALPDGLPIATLLIPVSYAALRYGLSGSLATAAWATVLCLPDLFLPHDHGHVGADLIELALVDVMAVFIGRRLDAEHFERLRVEAATGAQLAAESLYHQLFDDTAAPILLVDDSEAVREANPAARRQLGETVVGQSLYAVLGCTLDMLGSQSSRVTLTSPAGERRDFRVRPGWVRITPSGERLAHLVLEDVTEERAEGERARRYAARLLTAQEEERRRIARELHDEPLQLLVHLGRHLERLESAAHVPAEVATGLSGARQEAHDIADRLRMLVGGLRPPALEQFGLVAALRGFLVRAEEDTAAHLRLRVLGTEARLAPEVELVAFRITQEAVNNAVLHAEAEELCVTLEFAEGSLGLEVSDDGRGFEAASLDQQPEITRLGLLGMQERAEILGGHLEIRTSPGHGTTVRSNFPLRP